MYVCTGTCVHTFIRVQDNLNFFIFLKIVNISKLVALALRMCVCVRVLVQRVPQSTTPVHVMCTFEGM